ncbi:MAG: collagen-like protein [Dehalococcoidia bacterium]|nr:collagen-like protein [Dehalococcoidia bacterium]
MTMRQLVPLVLALAIFISAISAATTYGMVQAFGKGEQGVQGAIGLQGERGLRGSDGADASPFPPGGLLRLTEMWALAQINLQNPGQTDTTTTGSAQVIACIRYILHGTNSAAECGFSAAD